MLLTELTIICLDIQKDVCFSWNSHFQYKVYFMQTIKQMMLRGYKTLNVKGTPVCSHRIPPVNQKIIEGLLELTRGGIVTFPHFRFECMIVPGNVEHGIYNNIQMKHFAIATNQVIIWCQNDDAKIPEKKPQNILVYFTSVCRSRCGSVVILHWGSTLFHIV